MFSMSKKQFGPDFTFGVATASYQVEGGQTDGRGMSIWDSFSATPGNVADNGTGIVACDHYQLWPQDLDLISDGGFDAYRFSLAWSRLLPQGMGAVNQKGLDFYDRLIDGMLARGLKPYATLYHWDMPSALMDKGGWLNRDMASWFADYAVLVQQKFGDRLSAIATINEPWCVAYLSHFLGVHAPGLSDVRAASRAMHHVLLAHGSAVTALRAEGAKNLGIVLNLQASTSASNSAADHAATHLFDGTFNRWYLDGLFKAQYPKDVVACIAPYLPERFEDDMQIIATPLDWLGVNYYSRSIIAADPEAHIFPFKIVEGPLEKTDIGWEIYPQGLTELLTRVSNDYTKLPIYITENGMAEVLGIDDQRRVKYFEDHLKAVLAAKAQGVDVQGYFAWSLLDNFEWAEGYLKRFGLVEVDYSNQKRLPRASYKAFQGMLHNAR